MVMSRAKLVGELVNPSGLGLSALLRPYKDPEKRNGHVNHLPDHYKNTRKNSTGSSRASGSHAPRGNLLLGAPRRVTHPDSPRSGPHLLPRRPWEQGKHAAILAVGAQALLCSEDEPIPFPNNPRAAPSYSSNAMEFDGHRRAQHGARMIAAADCPAAPLPAQSGYYFTTLPCCVTNS